MGAASRFRSLAFSVWPQLQDLPAPHLAILFMPDRENLAFEPGTWDGSSTLEVSASRHHPVIACGIKSAKLWGTEVGTKVQSCLRETYPVRSDPYWLGHLGLRMSALFSRNASL